MLFGLAFFVKQYVMGNTDIQYEAWQRGEWMYGGRILHDGFKAAAWKEALESGCVNCEHTRTWRFPCVRYQNVNGGIEGTSASARYEDAMTKPPEPYRPDSKRKQLRLNVSQDRLVGAQHLVLSSCRAVGLNALAMLVGEHAAVRH